MGLSHALAYTRIPDFDVVGVCTRHIADRQLPDALAGARRFSNYEQALAESRPDVVSVNTLPDTHAEFAIKAMQSGAHVFVEKPLAETVASAERVVETAIRTRRKLVIGYILRHHPSWVKFVEIARTLGTPLVFRMNLNQQSRGETWEWHKRLLQSFSPIVDCGVHYVDVMCQMTPARPIRVHALGAHLTDEVATYNYGAMQVAFDDGSVGWYEAGWGPMMSETAFFVKDVIGPKGSASIVMAETAGDVKSDDINAHTKTNQILWHHTDQSKTGRTHRHDRRAGPRRALRARAAILAQSHRRRHRSVRAHERRSEEPQDCPRGGRVCPNGERGQVVMRCRARALAPALQPTYVNCRSHSERRAIMGSARVALRAGR